VLVVVDAVVVAAAEQDGVVEVGRAAVRPVDDVVGLAPAGWGGAAGPAAVAVAGGDGGAGGGGEGAGDRPTSMGSPAGSRTIRRMVASQPIRRAALPLICSP
jgi:hypothetical protein